MTPVEILTAAQKIWDKTHGTVADKIDNSAGGYYLIVQKSGGDIAFEGAKNSFTHEDTLDEIIVGVAGDTIQDALLIAFSPGKSISIGIEALGYKDISLGNALKGAYKYIKRDIANQYWDYVKNWEATPNDGVYNPIPYAKIAMHKNNSGQWVPYVDNGTGMYVYQPISQAEYNAKIAAQNNFYQTIYGAKLDTTIENTNGVLKVTMPDGTIYAQGDNAANTIYGASKNDWLYGMGGNDYLEGGEGSDKLDGGEGSDTYVSGNGDVIYDSDGSGMVMFEGRQLTGGRRVITKEEQAQQKVA